MDKEWREKPNGRQSEMERELMRSGSKIEMEETRKREGEREGERDEGKKDGKKNVNPFQGKSWHIRLFLTSKSERVRQEELNWWGLRCDVEKEGCDWRRREMIEGRNEREIEGERRKDVRRTSKGEEPESPFGSFRPHLSFFFLYLSLQIEDSRLLLSHLTQPLSLSFHLSIFGSLSTSSSDWQP